MEYCIKMGQKEREKQIKICYMGMKHCLKDHWAETNFFEKGYILQQSKFTNNPSFPIKTCLPPTWSYCSTKIMHIDYTATHFNILILFL